MKKSKAVFSEIISALELNDSTDEKQAIARLLMDHFFNLGFSALLTDSSVETPDRIKTRLDDAISRINKGEPVQYVIGWADFCGNRFLVSPDVLIPRPETEELVAEAVKYCKRIAKTNPVLVDIGTGSGCLPVTLALKMQCEVWATDLSENALNVARSNARNHHVNVHFLKHDILNESLPIKSADVVISNPPYITESEMDKMNHNVTKFEPHLALFVPDEKPLLFYESIAAEAIRILSGGGMIIFEINERFGKQVADLLQKCGFDEIEIVKDISGKERIVKAIQPLKS
jgi:release factor glutamine methyltransferase